MAEDRFGWNSGGAVGNDTRVAVPFGKPPPVSADDQRDMAVVRCRQAQSTLNENLRRGRRQEVVSSHNFRDTHHRIVHHHGKRIARAIRIARKREVAQGLRDILAIDTRKDIREFDLLLPFHAKTPARRRLRSTSRNAHDMCPDSEAVHRHAGRTAHVQHPCANIRKDMQARHHEAFRSQRDNVHGERTARILRPSRIPANADRRQPARRHQACRADDQDPPCGISTDRSARARATKRP